MTRSTLRAVLDSAATDGRAIAACNVYTLDQAAGVVDAATELGTPVILQVHPGGVGDLLWPLVGGLRWLADGADTPVVVHLDHVSDPWLLHQALEAPVDSVMVDGSMLPLTRNIGIVREFVTAAAHRGIEVEAELGRLSGEEDGIAADGREILLTDPAQVASFVALSGASALAVCVGNVHGASRTPPIIDLERLAAIRAVSPVPLVLHGGSGVPDLVLRAAVARGVSKVNVNTELRGVYRDALTQGASRELAGVLSAGRAAVKLAALAVIGRLGTAERR